MGTEKSLNQILQEESGLGPNWVVADQPAIRPGRVPAPPQGDTENKYLQGSLPPASQHDTSFVGTEYKGARIPSLSVQPLGPSGQAAANSGVHNTTYPLLFPVQQQTEQNSADIATNTTAIANLQATSFSEWSATTTYSLNQGSIFNEIAYISIQNGNLNNEPDVSPTFWTSVGQESFLGVWNSGTAYTISQVVETTSPTTLWIALQSSTNKNPTNTSGFWQQLNPATIAAYSSGTTYFTNNLVTSGGGVFAALQTTTGNAPSTPPTSNSFWSYIGPSDLSLVPDSTQRFAATSSVLSYIPTSNPLSSVDSGASAEVDVASFTLQTSSKGSISYSSGSITGLSYGTKYFVGMVDATLAGGAATYNAYSTKQAVLSAGALFIGSIITAASGGSEIFGAGDGGTGNQYGQTSVFLFGTATPTVTSPGTVTNASRAIDGSLTSFAALATNAGSGVSVAQLLMSAASPTSAPWSSLTLNVLSAVPINNFNGTDGTVIVQVTYSYQSGSGTVSGTLWSIAAGVTRALTTDTLSLPASVNLATLQITAKVSRSTGTHNCEIDVYECWVTGVI